ncbi:GntR family transcriptional regulator [Acetobacterium bakii]|uniref:GntR family transcriptional regulator n=1 Tax=Acetobacterium bakii TaxID=52689 RepID=UPI00241EA6A2|nr:GntR family transcriptional regulator [Acetobacterium bakii]
MSEIIKTKIQKEIYPVNMQIPPENTLADEFGVSRITIRNALSSLIDDGYIYSIPGKGNYVLDNKNDKFLLSLKTVNLLKKPFQRVEMLGSEIIKPTIDLVYRLRVAPDARVVYIRWVLFYEETPIAYDIHYIPYFPGITVWNDDFEYTSLSEILSQKNTIFQLQEKMSITAVTSSEEVAKVLGIQVNTPVLQITQEISDDEEPMGMRRLYIKKEWCRIHGDSLNG